MNLKAHHMKRRRHNATGRAATEGQYAPLSYQFLRSPAWRSLRGPAAKVWLELRCRYNGSNNGKLALSCDAAARLLGLGKATVLRAFQELQDKGFIVMTQRGQWYGRRATTWAVTDKPCDGHLATRAWNTWIPDKKAIPQNHDLGVQTDRGWMPTVPPQN